MMNLDRGKIELSLKRGKFLVDFTKVNGDQRKILCTLSQKFMPKAEFNVSRVEAKRQKNTETLSVWDLESESWKSFRVNSVKSVEQVKD
tara:strand:- start:1202 stop:1468 length:267 start_codon:yes stop_codon:yes gene_type:complete